MARVLNQTAIEFQRGKGKAQQRAVVSDRRANVIDRQAVAGGAEIGGGARKVRQGAEFLAFGEFNDDGGGRHAAFRPGAIKVGAGGGEQQHVERQVDGERQIERRETRIPPVGKGALDDRLEQRVPQARALHRGHEILGFEAATERMMQPREHLEANRAAVGQADDRLIDSPHLSQRQGRLKFGDAQRLLVDGLLRHCFPDER